MGDKISKKIEKKMVFFQKVGTLWHKVAHFGTLFCCTIYLHRTESEVIHLV